jgi:hypothetical protein
MTGTATPEFVVLTDRPGTFHTRGGSDTRAVECWNYAFCGRIRAHFVIAALLRETRIEVVDETLPVTVSRIPSRHLKKYASVEDARRDLAHLARPGNPDVSLIRVDLPGPSSRD